MFWSNNDVNSKWFLFYAIVNRAADKLCPIISMKFNLEIEGWFTKEVLESIVEKNRLFKIAKCNRTYDDWEIFKTYRKYARNLLLNTREVFLKNKIAENKGNPRAFWRKLNTIVGYSSGSQCFTSIFNDDGKKIEKLEAAEYMNDYFTNIGTKLNENNNSFWTPHSFFPHYPTNNFLLNVVDENIVRKYVKALDISKPSGISNLNNMLLRDAFNVLTCELTAMFNESIVQEIFPYEWKKGTITPIPKSGNLMDKTNWRPITILNTFGKLLEKIIHFQTCIYLKLNEILSDDQHGFRKEHNTSSAVMEFL